MYNIGVRRSGKLTGKENRPMDEKVKALKELLEILVEHSLHVADKLNEYLSGKSENSVKSSQKVVKLAI